MQFHGSIRPIALILALIAAPSASRAADVLQNVPADALGFVVVKDIGATDAKFEQWFKTLQLKLPGPLAFLKSTTNVGDGLNRHGDFLLVVMPPKEQAPNKWRFCVWLPIDNFDRFLAPLGPRPAQGGFTITVAGESLLAARHGDWVLVMDADQRARMDQILAARPNSEESVAHWRSWANDTNVAVVALPGGIDSLLATKTPAAGEPPAGAKSALHAIIQKWTAQSPQLAAWLKTARAIGVTLRLDDRGNAQLSARVASSDDRFAFSNDGEKPSPPDLYEGGHFILNAAGNVPRALSVTAAQAFVRWTVDDLRQQQRLVLDDEAVAQFQQALEQAAADVTAAQILTQPGEKSEGIYTNDFLVVRTQSAAEFINHASEVLRLWNTMNRDAEGEARLVFDVAEQKLGNRAATQYALDIAAAEGVTELPEVREAMQKFFGPSGKMQLWIVAVDDATVLIATATADEIKRALETLDRKQPVNWSRPELAAANELLPQESDWRLFVSPHAYHDWIRRRNAAITGPVLGGPSKKKFEPSPPIAVAGGFRNRELWIDAAIPAETIKAAGNAR